MKTRNRPAAPLSDELSEATDTGPSASERFVAKLAGVFPKSKSTRRSFLAKTAVVGSALSVSPLDFMLKPASAYDVVCGSGNTCGEGWSVFCCTINGGFNSCPPGSFTGGWWKADNSSFCGGFARYYIDCNQSCSSPCGCFCPTGTCDNRKTCCNQFRYGQCNQQIGCAGPVRCRIITCTPPWQYDASCGTASATDNRTADHNAPCNPGSFVPPPPPPPPPPGALANVTNVATNLDGRLEVFAIGTNGGVWHNYQVAINSGWAGWENLGGSFPLGTAISVGRNLDGRLEVFALGSNGAIWHNYQVAPNSPWAGFFSMSPAVFNQPPTVGRNADGRLEVFTVGTDGQIYHAWQNAPNNAFSAFEALGGNFNSPPVVGRNLDGRLEVFGVGTNGQLWHAWQTATGAPFSSFQSFGGSFQHTRPTVAANLDGRLQVFVVGTDAAIQYVRQTAANSGWGPITGLGGIVTQPPSAIRNQDGRLEVFVIGFDKVLYHSWQTSPGGGWSAFDALGGSFDHPPAVVFNPDGRLEVFCIGTDDAMYHEWQVAPNSSWGGLDSLGGTWT